MGRRKRNKSEAAIRRAASEIKRYRFLRRLIPALMGIAATGLTIAYVATVMYGQFGSFTVSVNKYDNIAYSITLSETPEFNEKAGKLSSKATEDITNISVDDLPQNLNRINGEHNGTNYIAYTFYCMNNGDNPITYEYNLYVSNMTLDIEKAVRVRVYANTASAAEAESAETEVSTETGELDETELGEDVTGLVFGDEYTDYAYTRSDGTGPEPGTEEFLTDKDICIKQVENFKPGDITKYTVVIWLEGDDPECVDKILGGVFRVDMSLTVVGVTENGEYRDLKN